MTPELRQRIDAMLARDTAVAAAFVLVLWIVIGFVFFEMTDLAGSAITTVLLVGGALVVLFNTVSITAMVRHYREEKERIYGLDIEHLDAMRANNPDALNLPTIDELTKETR